MATRTEMVISERDFTATVIELARHAGWLAAHFRPCLSQAGRWLTAVQGDGVGFPDLVLVHPATGRLLFAELKTDRGRLTEAQLAWNHALAACPPAVEYECWRPKDMADIKQVLGVSEG